MTAPHRLWWRFGGRGAALGLLVLCAPLLMWGGIELRRSAAPATTVPIGPNAVPIVASRLGAGASAPLPIAQAMPTSAVAPKAAATRVSTDARLSTLPAAQDSHWELCGIGRIPKPQAVPGEPEHLRHELPAHLGQQVVESALRRTLQALAAGTDRQRVAQLMLKIAVGEPPDTVPPGWEPGDDAVVLDWTLRLCVAAGQACDPALARRWTELEPDNAAAWMTLAQVDPQQREAALRRASEARAFSSHEGVLLDVAMKAVPTDVPAHALVEVWPRLLSAGHASMLTAPVAAIRYCRPSAATAGDRLAMCGRMGRLLYEEGDTLFAQHLGMRLQELGGLPAPAGEAQRKFLQEAAAMPPFDMAQPYACSSVEAMRGWMARRTQGREIDAMRADLAAGPKVSAPPRRVP